MHGKLVMKELVSVIARKVEAVRRTAVLPRTGGVALIGPSYCLQRNKKESKSNESSHFVLAVPVRYPSQTCPSLVHTAQSPAFVHLQCFTVVNWKIVQEATRQTPGRYWPFGLD